MYMAEAGLIALDESLRDETYVNEVLIDFMLRVFFIE